MNNEIKIHDYGFVRLVNHMGNDDAIVQAARVSYGNGTKTQREDKKLLTYLMKNKHTTPFEMVQLKFHVKLPIFVARQWIRHRTGSFNEVSARYSILPSEFYYPDLKDITTQDIKNRQGRTDKQIRFASEALEIIKHHSIIAYSRYETLTRWGVARELARIVLPLNIYTEWYWSVNLKNLLDFLCLRTASDAQREFQAYAKAIIMLVEPIVPNTIAIWREK